MSMVGVAVVAGGVSLLLAPGVLWILHRRQILDLPNDRSSHHAATPRGGGLAPAVGAVVALLASTQLAGPARTGLLVAAVGMGGIGLADDLRRERELPAPYRLGLQALVAGVSVALLAHSLSGALAWKALFLVGAGLWIVAFVNAYNFMDGINGISTAQVVVAGIVWTAIGETQHAHALAVGGAVAAGAMVAFGPFNFPRAAMFLGDVGSYFFGAWLAAVAVIGVRAHVPAEAVLAPLVVYGLDTLVTLARRISRREAWMTAHREHAYQRLVQAGWSHTRTSLAVAAAIVLCSGLGCLSLTGSLALRGLGDVLAVAVAAGYVATPSWLGRRRHRAPARQAA
jgi:UDP-GlcNAc:undecaprenyl-phosphate GlcNAc-1-phosphate transferase